MYRPDITSTFEKGTANVEMIGKKWRRSPEKNYDSAIRLWVREGDTQYPTIREVEDYYVNHLRKVISKWMKRIVTRQGWQLVNEPDIRLLDFYSIEVISGYDTEFRAMQKLIRDPDFLVSQSGRKLRGKVLALPQDMYTYTYLKAPKGLPKAIWVVE